MATTPVKERVKKWRERQKAKGRKPCNFVLTEEASRELEVIKERTKIQTISEVVNRSISVYSEISMWTMKGYKIFLIPEDDALKDQNSEKEVKLTGTIIELTNI